jgi:hypothetical protein
MNVPAFCACAQARCKRIPAVQRPGARRLVAVGPLFKRAQDRLGRGQALDGTGRIHIINDSLGSRNIGCNLPRAALIIQASHPAIIRLGVIEAIGQFWLGNAAGMRPQTLQPPDRPHQASERDHLFFGLDYPFGLVIGVIGIRQIAPGSVRTYAQMLGWLSRTMRLSRNQEAFFSFFCWLATVNYSGYISSQQYAA